MSEVKPFSISKRQVWEAYKVVKANDGAAGVDGQTIEAFDKDLTNNLFKLWNRMSSGIATRTRKTYNHKTSTAMIQSIKRIACLQARIEFDR